MANFYNEKVQYQNGADQFMEYWWSKKSINIRTTVPAIILSVNYTQSCVNVKPLIKVFVDRDRSFELPESVDVPLSIVSAKRGLAGLTMPIIVGDIGILEYADQDTSDWLSSNGDAVVGTPSSTASRENQSTGSVLYPLAFTVGIFTKSKPMNIDPVNVVLFNEDSLFIQHPDGTITTKNTNGSTILYPSGKQIHTSGSSVFTIDNGTNTLTDGSSVINQSGGVVLINGATITPSGNLITASGTDLDAFKAAFDSHLHSGVQSGPNNTGGIV